MVFCVKIMSNELNNRFNYNLTYESSSISQTRRY